MLRKRPSQPSFLPRSASRIPCGLGVWVSSGPAAAPARSPSLCLCRPTEAGELLFPKGSTRYPLDLPLHPHLPPSFHQTFLFTNEGDSGEVMDTRTQAWTHLGWWGAVKGTEGPQTDDSNTFANKTSVKAPRGCCLPTPHHGHHQPHMHTFSFYPAETRLKRTSLKDRTGQSQDSLNAEYGKGAGLLKLFPLGISRTREVRESRISNVQINPHFI